MSADPLEPLLRTTDAAAGEPTDLSPDLAARVRGILARRRRRIVRIKIAGALVGCYVAGMVTLWTVSQITAGGEPGSAHRRWIPSDKTPLNVDARSFPERGQDASQTDSEPPTPVQPELVVVRSRYSLLRKLGDECRHRGDMQAAVAYYGQALDVATSTERQVSYEQDDWLLISLKNDRFSTPSEQTHGDSI